MPLPTMMLLGCWTVLLYLIVFVDGEFSEGCRVVQLYVSASATARQGQDGFGASACIQQMQSEKRRCSGEDSPNEYV